MFPAKLGKKKVSAKLAYLETPLELLFLIRSEITGSYFRLADSQGRKYKHSCLTYLQCHLQASIAHHSGTAHILSMFFHDDVMAWNKQLQGKTHGTTLLSPP